MVARIINLVATILEDFTFQREIGAESDDDHALVFGARIGDLSIQGCDSVHTDAKGLIDEFTVMLRPLRAVHAFEDHDEGAVCRRHCRNSGQPRSSPVSDPVCV